jgi:two-component system phosphate regulon sensor histidine kinase PhoR
MADEGRIGEGAGRLFERLAVRLRRRTALLATVAAVLVGLIAFAGLSLAGAALGLAAIAAGAALLPIDDGNGPLTSAASATSFEQAGLQLFADALPDPCVILDHRAVVVHRNGPAATQFPGLALGAPMALSLRAPAVLAAIESVRRDGRPQTVELYQTVPTETWHRVTVAPLVPDEIGGLLVVTLQSLTDERRLEALRTDFIANASHELRTPLTSLLGFIDTLMGPAAKDPAAQKKFLDIMRVQAIRMSKLIEDLLSLSRIEMRQHVRPVTRVDLALLLREVREGLLTQAQEVGAMIEVEAPNDPVEVTGDRDELYEVFENLIDNALKYGADGGKVEVALGPVGNRQGYDYLVSVTDHGPGIEADHVPRLTERFYRVDAESSRRKKGTGLGLAIVKHIVTRHRGLLSIRSRLGEGTRVDVFLPR